MTTTKSGANRIHGLESVSDAANDAILATAPYRVEVEIVGDAPILFHRFGVEAVEGKAAAGKNTKAKKTDDIESYVYRDAKGRICIPGEYLRQAIIEAGRYRQDPRSPRKSARDLFKAIVISLTEVASLGKDTWDYLDQRRAVVQRSGIVRRRPAFQAGWRATFVLQVQAPEYLDESTLRQAIVDAGRLVGVGDFRPTYGRFGVVRFERKN